MHPSEVLNWQNPLNNGKTSSIIYHSGWPPLHSTIKAINGTWISLCEYKKNKKGLIVPFFALSGQIGNDEYKDCNGKVLSEKEIYILHDKKFSPTINDDGLLLIKISTKKMNDVEVIKCKDLDGEEVFCVRKDNLSSGGEFDPSNLAYKYLRRKGILDKLTDLKNKIEDNKLTLK